VKKIYFILILVLLASVFASCASNGDQDEVKVSAPEAKAEDEKSSVLCVHGEDTSFHDCQIIFEYLEENERTNEFDEWSENILEKCREENDPDCAYIFFNVYDCLKYFDVPRDFFEDRYTSTYYVNRDFDIDLLYNGTREEVFDYYCDLEARYETHKKKGSEHLLKTHMVDLMDAYDKFSLAINTFSIPEFIYATKMTKEQFYLAKERAMQNNNAEIFYDYDIDDVYENREFYEDLIPKLKPYYIDMMIKK